MVTKNPSVEELLQALRVEGGKGSARLDQRDSGETFGWDKEQSYLDLADEMAELVELQKRLFADSSSSVLVVLQAMDAAGKDSTIRSIFSGLNPAGVDVNPFGVPT
ncbi:MAG: polyphosphate kinase 2 (PPK2 family), partial [Ilumatobacter sp.]